MAKDPDDRFATATEMAAALQSPSGAAAAGDPTMLGAQTVLDAPALGVTQRVSGPSATAVLSSPGAMETEVGHPAATPTDASWASRIRSHPGALAGAAVVALFMVVVLIGTRGGSSSGPTPTTTPTTAAAAATAATIPAGLDQALKHLEEAVRP